MEGTPQNKRKTPKVGYGFVALDPWLVLVGFSPQCKCKWYLTTGHMLLHCCCWRINVWLWKLCDIIPVFLACFFSLLFLFLTNDMTPPPPPCVPPMIPRPSPSKTLSFTLFFQKTFAVFTRNETTTMFSSMQPQGKYIQWHSLTTVDVWKAPLWTPWKRMKTYLHELNKIIKKSFFSFFFFSFFFFLLFYLWSYMES